MDTIFVKNVKEDGPAHRAGLRTGELSQLHGSSHSSGSLLPTLWLGWNFGIQVLGRLLSPTVIHTWYRGSQVGPLTPSGLLTCGPVPGPQETGW